MPKLKDDAPQWVVDSYNHYMQQQREEYVDKLSCNARNSSI